uniref:Uncharacterized protein n=1 Tax=Pygocentrus nattereri TaxID=42514 RepID=A0AAR2IR24_PYGNA
HRFSKFCGIFLFIVTKLHPNELMSTYVYVSDFLNLRRKYRRHYCPHKRCLPLHSRVPFP